MTIHNDTVACGRVSSLFVSDNVTADFVEVGWFEDPAGGSWDYLCLSTTSGPPKRFGYASRNGIPSCSSGPELSIGVDGFTLKDPDQDGVWIFGHDGANFWSSPDMGDFNSGSLEVNGERAGDGSEPARSEFDGLDRMNETNTWLAWTSPYELNFIYSDDPDFRDCIDAGDHIRVVREGTPC